MKSIEFTYPRIRAHWARARKSMFFWIVVLPVALAVLYFGCVASDIYVSESRFVVRSPDKQVQSGLGAFLQGTGFNRSQDNVYVVHDFITSRDALSQLEKSERVSTLFGASSVDRFSRFGGLDFDRSFEALYRYYDRRVSVDVDSTSAITTLRVNAFTAQSAYQINHALLEMAEHLVNKMSVRAQADLIASAQKEVDAARVAAQEAGTQLARYRTAQKIFDPDKQSSLQLQQISKLQDEIVLTRTQISQIKAFAPENPQLSTLQTRLVVLEQEAQKQMLAVAGDSRSLTSKTTQYQRLQLDQVFADRQLISALATLESARNEAFRKQLYLEVIANPNTPDVAIRPNRLKAILVVLIGSLVVWGIACLVLAGVREHHD
ncbi:hypothetical protein QS306_03855 [Paraburkholderia bonniea]|uniref:hypothetical protein n=1 Tax=Paraburkholderia bonniea TaxID=2152891 RepID=UPI001FE318C6|nr:hypothetical protein [Paraburkholderia bonniea]WJF90810.1 hypothetical protein QS306_03855 [Paraburkholderia bonniea]WJF94124.1 hypothetical protein QS308_03855 [Paraburkholderia bonniea]